MDETDELAQLEQLLSADIDSINQTNEACVSEVNIFLSETNNPRTPNEKDEIDGPACPSTSAVHNGDTDSSDDEEKRNYTERKYNDYGTEVKKLLDNKEHEQIDKRLDFEIRLRQTNMDVKVERKSSLKRKPDFPTQLSVNNSYSVPEKNKVPSDVYTDPIFGIRIVKPLMSSSALLERMQGREAINMLRVKQHVENEDVSKDWVIGGVVVRKSDSKKSQKNNNFLIWTLSDLKDDMKTVSMFLFARAYSELWKTPLGTVVAILNPRVLDRSQNSRDQACLSVEKHDRVMILGQSKDLGTCKSKTKNGEPCNTFVNLHQCEHCIYHVKQEYQKFSRRQELQSSTMGKGLVNLQNKVLGKSTVTYGGKTYSALPSGNSKKVKEQDSNRLMSLSDYYKTEGDKLMTNKAPVGAGSLKNNSSLLHSPTALKKTDSDMLSKLNSSSSQSSQSLAERVANSPKLSQGFGLKRSGTIDLTMSYGQKAAQRTKENAIRLIQRSGGIQKVDPNNIKGTDAGKKRAFEQLNISTDDKDSKKVKPNEEIKPKGIMSERFKKILEATSAHQSLIEQHDDDEMGKYFNKLEKKEAMEEKMLNTFKLPCKAVRCAKCKYTAFSAAQICKDERHPLKVLDTLKRFFKCLDCNNRTVSLELIPLHSCSNCKSSRWAKAPMLREKKAVSLADGLSIRGEEETYVGGNIAAGKNINLLVPEN